jgi:two-component system OmpR family response regulator
MSDQKILVIEDDETLNSILKYNIEKEGYHVITAFDGLQGLKFARDENPNLVILDLMLPKMDGLEVCRILRKDTTVPIIMLTAKAEEIDKIVGLELGADDYMTKPFSIRELLARVRAMMRRSDIGKKAEQEGSISDSQVIRAGNFEIDLSRHSVLNGTEQISLNPKEFDLLVFLMRNKGQVFSRDTLLEKVWGYDFAGDTRTVDVHIRWLRQKIEVDPNSPKFLVTVRGVGYKFEVDN